MPTIKQTLEAALTARGETLVDTGKLDKWTRRYMGRTLDGKLLLNSNTVHGAFWFVGSNGALRAGSTRSLNFVADPRARQTLLDEGAAILSKSGSTVAKGK